MHGEVTAGNCDWVQQQHHAVHDPHLQRCNADRDSDYDQANCEYEPDSVATSPSSPCHSCQDADSQQAELGTPKLLDGILADEVELESAVNGCEVGRTDYPDDQGPQAIYHYGGDCQRDDAVDPRLEQVAAQPADESYSRPRRFRRLAHRDSFGGHGISHLGP